MSSTVIGSPSVSSKQQIADVIDYARLGRPLEGEVILITGAGRGIGREAAVTMAKLGGDIVIAEVSDAGAETEAAIREAGGNALNDQVDVSDLPAMTQLRDRAVRRFGHVDVVVNNACVFYAKPLLEYSLEEWDRVMAVNLRAAFITAKLFLPDMLARRHGVFITMESGDGMPYLAPYFASKVALRSLAASLSQEVGDYAGVSIFCFGPGMVDTPAIQVAVPKLAPLYGMSEAAFVSQSAPGGVLSSAQECAAGLAGCILHAAQFHGQETVPPAGLALLDQAVGSVVSQPRAQSTSVPVVPKADSTTASRDVTQLIADLRRECNDLGLFQRQWYKRTLKQATGLSLEDWEAVSQRNGWQADQLQLLAGYFKKLEGEARGFIKDPTKLKDAIAVLEQRRSTADSAATALATKHT